MTNKKLIFLIIAWVLVVGILLLVVSLKSSTNNTKNTWSKSSWTFNIWIVWDDKEKFNQFLTDFKTMNSNYSNSIFNVESFGTFEEYEAVLASALTRWEWPDLFVLNNNSDSFASQQIIWIDPAEINPNDFRKKYKGIFWDELISVLAWDDGKQIEYLRWIPVWYETLWIYYNRKYVKASDIDSLAWLSNVVSDIKRKKSSLVPIWIWNGSTVVWSEDIITQLFVQEWATKLSDISWSKLKWAFWTYFMYWNTSWSNRYDSKFISMKQDSKDNLDLFTDGILAMVVWYPRTLAQIDKNGYSKALLYASPFPKSTLWTNKTLLNYNYFVINKDTINLTLALDLLKYLSSDSWATKYLDKFTHYLPALLSLESDKFDAKVNSKYNIILRDFLNENSDLTSFDKWLKSVYDREIIEILDDSANYEELFKVFKTSVNCKKDKIISLQNLSSICD